MTSELYTGDYIRVLCGRRVLNDAPTKFHIGVVSDEEQMVILHFTLNGTALVRYRSFKTFLSRLTHILNPYDDDSTVSILVEVCLRLKELDLHSAEFFAMECLIQGYAVTTGETSCVKS